MLLLALACTPEPAPEPPPERVALRLGLASRTPLHGIAWVAQETGAFDDQLLDVEIVVLQGSRSVARALDADEIDWGLLDGSTVLRWDFEGGDLVLVAGLVERSFRRIVSRRDLEKPAGLRGLTLAVGKEHEAEHLAAMVALDALDVPIESIEWVHESPATFKEVRSRELDAQLTATPPERLQQLDLHVVVELSDAPVEFTTMQLATRDANARSPEAARLVAALSTASSHFEDRPATAALLAPHLELEPDDVEARLARLGPEPFHVRTDHTAGLQAILDLLAREDVLYENHLAEELLP